MDRKGESMCNRPMTGADAVYLTPATMSVALDHAISMALSPPISALYLEAVTTKDPAVLFRNWYQVMQAIDDDPCSSTRPRSDWRTMFEGYDSLKRGILTRFKSHTSALMGNR